MGKTLAEWLKDKITGKKPVEPVPNERKYYNPLKLNIGDPVTLDEMNFRGLDFKVQYIREVKLQFNKSGAYPMVDYDLIARSLSGDPVKAKLRLAPKEDPDNAAELTHDAILLKFDDELGADSGIEDNVLNDNTGQFNVDEDNDGKDDSFFTRVNDVKDPYTARVTVLDDRNHDGKVSDNEVQSFAVKFWDFYRTAESIKKRQKDGSWVDEKLPEPATEFLIVEKDINKSWFTIWRGFEFNTDRIQTLKV